MAMNERYGLETTCLDCRKQMIHAMAAALQACRSCGSRRINSRMISDEVIERHLKDKAAPPD